jgi:hypothetical protein
VVPSQGPVVLGKVGLVSLKVVVSKYVVVQAVLVQGGDGGALGQAPAVVGGEVN